MTPHVPPDVPDGPAALRRDRLTLTGYAALAAWAWFLYGFGAVVPLLRDEQGTSRAISGLHLTAQAAGGLLAGIAALALVRRWRRRGTGVLGCLLVAGGLLPLVLLREPALTLAATFVIGLGGTMIVNVVSPAMVAHHGRAGPAAISESGAAAAAVGLVAPLAVGAAVAAGLTWRPAMIALVAAMLGVAVLLRRMPAAAAMDAAPPPRAGRSSGLPRAFWPPAGVVVLCVGVEFSMSTWTADLMRDRVALTPAAASAAVSAVVGGMAVGRWVAGRLALTRPPRTLLIGAILLAGVGWAVTWTATHPVLAVAGLVVTGLGVAGHYPLGVALALAAAPGQEDAATGGLAIGMSLAIGLAPFALGALADGSGIHRAFLVVPGLLLTAVVLLLTATRHRPTVV